MPQRFRILHCMRAPVGGLFRHVLDLAAEQTALGHPVGILADSSGGDRLTEQRFAAIEPKLALGLHRVRMSRRPGIGDLAAACFTTRVARRTKASILHGHGAKGGAYARLAGQALKTSGVPVASFYTPHGGTLNFAPGSLEGRFYLGLERALGRATDGLVFESAYAARLYGERVGAPDVARCIIPNGLQATDFVEHRPADDAADVLFIGELRPVKGVDVLLKALRQLNEKRRVTGLIVGSGVERDSLRILAAELGLAERVRFAGAMPAAVALPRGRILVVPSRAESFPYVVLEAAAAGMPLVATNVGGIPEIVDGSGVGLVPPGDEQALADAIGAALADTAAACAQASRLKARVAATFTVAEMTRAVVGFYGERLASRARTGARLRLSPQSP